ncbi:MAG: 50S ribosomal protein L18 [Actinomycetota bacterium]|nr:50S ribosomal protein L18 [Actinomycetota bacterium]
MKTELKAKARSARHRRVRKKVTGTPERPRLAVYRSNRHIYAQVIDDVAGRTLASASTLADGTSGDPKKKAKEVGLAVAEAAKTAGVGKVTFDRGGFKYHGQVRAVADGAREGGLEL